MMKMNFSFLKNAGSVFLLLLFLCMGSFATAQSMSTSPSSGVSVSILKGYNNFVSKSQALEIFGAEMATILVTNPAGGQAEATHAVKKAFLIKAANVLKMDGSIMEALTAGNNAAIATVQTFGNSVNVNTDNILIYYAELVSL